MKKNVETKNFFLLCDPYIDGIGKPYFTASAFCPDDPPDEDGNTMNYRVFWDVFEGYDFANGDDQACDWDNISRYHNDGMGVTPEDREKAMQLDVNYPNTPYKAVKDDWWAEILDHPHPGCSVRREY